MVSDIMKAAAGWAREAPPALQPPVKAVCIRLGEMVADQRNYFAPLPLDRQQERTQVLALVAERLAAASQGLEKQLQALTELELRSTSSWSLVPTAQAEWITTAVRYLESCTRQVPLPDRPDPYWADDVVAGVIASVRAVMGIDELHARTEAQYPGQRKSGPTEELEEI